MKKANSVKIDSMAMGNMRLRVEFNINTSHIPTKNLYIIRILYHESVIFRFIFNFLYVYALTASLF